MIIISGELKLFFLVLNSLRYLKQDLQLQKLIIEKILERMFCNQFLALR